MEKIEDLLEQLNALHGEVEKKVSVLEHNLGKTISCKKGCHECCIDDLTVFEIEAINIQRHYPELLKNETPAKSGQCAFLNEEGACRIYEYRPYVCRTQGLPLSWMDYDDYDELVEMRDICPLNDKEQEILSFGEDQLWKIGPFEEHLAKIQVELDGGKLHRIPLRNLFNNEGV